MESYENISNRLSKIYSAQFHQESSYTLSLLILGKADLFLKLGALKSTLYLILKSPQKSHLCTQTIFPTTLSTSFISQSSPLYQKSFNFNININLQSAFFFRHLDCWNALPVIKQSSSLSSFKRLIKFISFCMYSVLSATDVGLI